MTGACYPYESDKLAEIMGETLRPGGFELTALGVGHCGLTRGSTVLDLGCGRGATVNYLRQEYGINAAGIDASKKLIGAAGERYGCTNFQVGRGERLPYEDESFDGVFAECTLSLMKNLEGVIRHVSRVLKAGGWFIISDIYAKNPAAVPGLRAFPTGGCLRGIHDLEELEGRLRRAGFTIALVEDHSQHLTEMIVKLGFAYGSLCSLMTGPTSDTEAEEFYKAIKLCKPSYFLLTARKEDLADG